MPDVVDSTVEAGAVAQYEMNEVVLGDLHVKLSPVFSAVTNYRDVPHRASILNAKGEPADETIEFCQHSCENNDTPLNLKHGEIFWSGIHNTQVVVRQGGDSKSLRLSTVEIKPLVGALTNVSTLRSALPFGTVDARAAYENPDFLPLFNRLVVPEDATLEPEFVQALQKWERQGGIRMSIEEYQKYRRVTNESIKSAVHLYLSQSLVRTFPLSWIFGLFLLAGSLGMICFWTLRKNPRKQMRALLILSGASAAIILLLTHFAFPRASNSVEIVLQHSDANGTAIVGKQTRLARFFGGEPDAIAADEEAYTRPAGRLPACSYEDVPADTVECDPLHREVSRFSTSVQKVPRVDFNKNVVDISGFKDVLAVMRAGSGQGFAWAKGRTKISDFNESAYDTFSTLKRHERQLIESIANQGYNVVLSRQPDGKLLIWGML